MNAERALQRSGLDYSRLRAVLHPIQPGDVNLWPASRFLRSLWATGVSAVTIGRVVLIDPEALEGDPRRLARLVAHELIHVRQYRESGIIRFLSKYLRQYLGGRMQGLSHRRAYQAIDSEAEARAVIDALL